MNKKTTSQTTSSPRSRLEKKPTINSWTRHALCDSVLSYERNRWKFEHVIRNSIGNEIESIYNHKYFEIWTFHETWAWAACGQTCTSFIRRKFRIYVNPKRRQNGFVWKVDTWISNKLRWIVSRNVECSFESFWCLQEKLYHWRRKFNWLRKHFKIEIRGIFLNVVDYGPQNFFFLLWSIFHLVIISQLKALFSCKVGHK